MMNWLTGCVMILTFLPAVAVGADYTKDSLETVKKSIADGKAVLIDVREPSEWNAGHIDKAILLPLSELNNGLQGDALKKRIPDGKILYTHCKTGPRARLGADRLKAAGYDVRALKAGYQDLIDAGFPKGNE